MIYEVKQYSYINCSIIHRIYKYRLDNIDINRLIAYIVCCIYLLG